MCVLHFDTTHQEEFGNDIKKIGVWMIHKQQIVTF